jgi:putative transcriptional regulator
MVNKALSGQELGDKLLQAVKEMNARKVGRVTQVQLNEVSEARNKTGLTQSQFAQVLKISPRTLQEWEQGRRKPSGAAKALIQIAFRHPDIIREDFLRR